MRTSTMVGRSLLLGLLWVAPAAGQEPAPAGTTTPPASAPEAPPAGADPEEWQAFKDTLERYRERMSEFQSEARAIVDAHETEERAKISSSYGAAMTRLEENENALRRVAITRLEAFLDKYPDSPYTADMLFRLADLYFEESELAFVSSNEEYSRLEDQAMANPDMVLPPPPLKDYARSMALYDRIIREHQDYENLADTYYMLAWCYSASNAEQEDLVAARDANQIIVDRWPHTPFSNDANMRLGEYYFDEPGTAVNVPRAIAYYEAVIEDGPEGRNYDEAIYKLGWSHYKLNNYDRALAFLVQLLDYSDTQFLQTGKVSNMRPEAVEYLAISYADIADRQARRPVEVATTHLTKVGDRKWSHDVVERLAEILLLQAKFDDSIETFRFLQEKWPLDPKNPVYQHRIAVIYSTMPVPDPTKAARAMAELSEKYSEGSAWYTANRANPDAIATARGFIETSLAVVAVELLQQAQQSGNVEDFALAAQKLHEFLEKFPFGTDYDLYEWYYALALFSSNQYAPAERAYLQILKNERSPYRDGARFQIMKSREQLVLAKYGRIDAVPADAVVEQVVTTQWNKQVTRYLLSDEHKAFIKAADDLTSREFTDPEWIPVLERDRAALAYLPAQILFNHGHYDEARARFDRVISLFPGTDEAVYASALYVNTLTNEGNLQAVQAYTTKFATLNLGKDPELRRAKLEEFADIREGAAFTIAYELIEKGDRAGAAQAYVDFMAEYPNSKFYKDALFNAANNYDLTGRAADAIRLFEQYVAKYPQDDRSKSLYFRIADTYSATLELQKSVQYYDTLVRLFPDYVDAPSALYNAAFLRVGMGDHAGAARAYERYATQYPNQPDAEPAFYRAGAQWELVGDTEALDFYNRYVKRYPSQDPNHQIEALYKVAKIYEKRRDTRRAAVAWQQVQSAFVANAARGVNSQARSMAAEGALNELLARFERMKTVKWTASEAKNVEILTKTKAEELKGILDTSIALIETYQDFETAAASLYVQGMAYFAYADMAFNIPPPKGLSEEEMGIYQQTIDERFRIPAEDKGKARLVASLEKAKAEKRWSDWNTKALVALNERYPSEYPSERQEARGAIRTGDIPFAGPASAR